jgi:hypothetical protein
MPKAIPLEEEIGKRYGRLVVVGAKTDGLVRCICDCGTTHTARMWSIRKGTTTSCGCYRREVTSANRRFHGEARITTEYTTWSSLKGRCLNPNNPKFERYGSRGITVCDRWKDSYSNFLEDMGRKPSNAFSLDRIDNNLGYCKENCRWADLETQANNKCTAITFNGKSQSIERWGRELEIPGGTIIGRIKRGWSIEKALSTPRQQLGTNQYSSLI